MDDSGSEGSSMIGLECIMSPDFDDKITETAFLEIYNNSRCYQGRPDVYTPPYSPETSYYCGDSTYTSGASLENPWATDIEPPKVHSTSEYYTTNFWQSDVNCWVQNNYCNTFIYNQNITTNENVVVNSQEELTSPGQLSPATSNSSCQDNAVQDNSNHTEPIKNNNTTGNLMHPYHWSTQNL